jgi:predicted dehydrogenase
VAEKPVRFAILGAGVAAGFHRRALAEIEAAGAKLVAMGHHDPAKFAAVQAQVGVPCRAVDDILDDPRIDAVCICTPTGQHAAQTIRAARAGKHVLVEKPMAMSLTEADAMIADCDEAGVTLGVVLQRRLEPAFRSVRSAIQAGRLGELTLGTVAIPYFRPQSYYESAVWRGTWALDGGVLMNQGIHLVDLLIWYMGDPIGIQAQAATLHRSIEVEDILVALLRFANGAMATITATTTVEPGFPHRVEVYGTSGGVQLEGESILRWQLKDGTVPDTLAAGLAADAGASGDPKAIPISGHVAVLRDVLAAIQDGRSPSIDGNEGRRSLATVLAVYAAAGVGAPANGSTNAPLGA